MYIKILDSTRILSEAGQIEAISEQVHDLMTEPRNKVIAKVTEQGRKWESRYLDIGLIFQRENPDWDTC